MDEVNRKKVLMLSSSDDNGAHLYAVKLCEILIEMGHEVKMLVKQKTTKKNFIQQFIYPKVKENILEKLQWRIKEVINPYKPLEIIDGEYAFISVDETLENINPEDIIKQIGFKPDFIFSAMTNRFLNSTDIKNLQKITGSKVITIMVDMNHLTGGCHFAWDCKGYIDGCGNYCPAIGDNPKAKINFETKFKNAKAGNFECLSGSGTTLEQIKKSKIYKDQKVVYNINSLIDTRIFNADNKDIAKRVFGLDKDTFYILAGAQSDNKRKGFEYLKQAVDLFSKQTNHRKAALLLVSHVRNKHFDEIKIPKKHLSFINDYRLLALLYQAADVFVNSSIEDSGPMMVSEALACGTPVVGFNTGIVTNMVISGYNGYKAELKNADDLAKGIEEIYHLNKDKYDEYSRNAVKQVVQFSSYEYAQKELNKMLN